MAVIDKMLEKKLHKMMINLELTYEEAMELHYFDKEENDNEEVTEIEAKVKAEKEANKPSTIGKVKNMKMKKKEDAQREGILGQVFGFVKTMADFKRAAQMTTSKMSFEAEDGTYYSVTITKHKSKPDGFDKKLVGEEETEAE